MKNLRVRGLVPQFENGQLHDPKEAGWSVLKYYLRFIGYESLILKVLKKDEIWVPMVS